MNKGRKNHTGFEPEPAGSVTEPLPDDSCPVAALRSPLTPYPHQPLVLSILLDTGLNGCEASSHDQTGLSLRAWAAQCFPCGMFIFSWGNFYLKLYLSLTWASFHHWIRSALYSRCDYPLCMWVTDAYSSLGAVSTLLNVV